ncbi:hypothetical protein B0H14DRAFT_2659246 [Mycena olivaceomarginata]|nr:hypothetical protein B0H14DRAFT_2659246 [Mycena olivaceomarginata]
MSFNFFTVCAASGNGEKFWRPMLSWTCHKAFADSTCYMGQNKSCKNCTLYATNKSGGIGNWYDQYQMPFLVIRYSPSQPASVYLILRLILKVSVAISGGRKQEVSVAPKRLPITIESATGLGPSRQIFGSSPGHPETVTHTDHLSYTQTRQPISGGAAAATLPLAKLHRQRRWCRVKTSETGVTALRDSTPGNLDMQHASQRKTAFKP